jgi:hypothetical protein
MVMETKIQARSVNKTKDAPKHEVHALQQNSASGENAAEKKLLRTPRTRKYVKMMQEVDKLSDNDKEIIETVQSLPVNNKLLGILSACNIEGCIIHAIDKWGNILQHFRDIAEMPPDLQQGYEVFLQYPDCTSVEVYTYSFCVIYGDGTVKFIDRPQD